MKYTYFVLIDNTFRSIAYDNLKDAVSRVNVLMFEGYNNVRIERI